MSYLYPRVNIKTTAISRPVRGPKKEDTVVMFAPFVSSKGPDNEIKKIYSLEEFISVYGDIDPKLQGQNGLNIMNWLTNGGTLYACRLTDEGDIAASANIDPISKGAAASQDSENAVQEPDPITVYSKFKGSYMNGTAVKITEASSYTEKIKSDRTSSVKENKIITQVYITLTDSITKKTIEKVRVKTSDLKNKISEVDSTVSQYIYIKGLTSDNINSFINASGILGGDEMTKGKDSDKSQDMKIKEFYTNSGAASAENLLSNKLEFPIDIVMDAGFLKDTKQAIEKFFLGTVDSNGDIKDAPIRDDVVLIMDCYGINDFSKPDTSLIDNIKPTSNYDNTDALAIPYSNNLAVYEQNFKVYDVITDAEIFVTPTYFLQTLIPYNAVYLNRGIQMPIAGLTRGVLSGVLYMNENPLPDEKNSWFKDKINYVERDSRQYAFMSQRTQEDPKYNTALQFLNNTLVTNKIVKDLEKLGREYLFEFNDAVTLSNMRKALNVYIGEWVANRTLSYAMIDVAKNEFSDEAVDVSINIKFTGTIEVISIDLVIE